MLRSVLRRTLSLNTTPDLDTIDAMPAEPMQDPDAPSSCPARPDSATSGEDKDAQGIRDATRGNLRRGDELLALRPMWTRPELPLRKDLGPGSCSRATSEDMERRLSGQSELSSVARRRFVGGRYVDASRLDRGDRLDRRRLFARLVQSDVSQRTSATSVVDSVGSDTSRRLALQCCEPSRSRWSCRRARQPRTTYATLPSAQRRLDVAQYQSVPSQQADQVHAADRENHQIKPIAVCISTDKVV